MWGKAERPLLNFFTMLEPILRGSIAQKVRTGFRVLKVPSPFGGLRRENNVDGEFGNWVNFQNLAVKLPNNNVAEPSMRRGG